MALILEKTFPDGFIAHYHRIGELKVNGPGEPCTVVLESYASQGERAKPGSKHKKTEYDFIAVSGSSMVRQAYRSILAMASWLTADSDEEYEPADIPAVISGTATWDGEGWSALAGPTFEELVTKALDTLDVHARRARARYVTLGQEDVYRDKAAQARAWALSEFSGDPPSYIALEAEQTEQDPVELAQTVIAKADEWDLKAPEIEGIRQGWRRRVRQAAYEEPLEQALDEGTAALDAL